jgi:hypothetical protein
VVDDIDNLRRGDGTRRRGKRERRIKEFKNGFWVSRIAYIRMGLEGSTEVGGELLGLLFIRSGPRAVTSS